MAELNRLGASGAGVGGVGRAHQDRGGPAQASQDEDSTKDGELGDHVEAAMEDLRHS